MARKTPNGSHRADHLAGGAGLVSEPIPTRARAGAAIPILGVSPKEGTYAMDIVFTVMPSGEIAGVIRGPVRRRQ